MSLSINRRGHIATMMLFVVALVLVVFTIFVFLSSSGDYENKSGKISDLLDLVSFEESYVPVILEEIVGEAFEMEGDFEENFLKMAAKRDVYKGGMGNVFLKIREKDYDLDVDAGTLRIEGVFVKGNVGNHEMTRNFDLIVSFGDGGVRVDKIYKVN